MVGASGQRIEFHVTIRWYDLERMIEQDGLATRLCVDAEQLESMARFCKRTPSAVLAITLAQYFRNHDRIEIAALRVAPVTPDFSHIAF